MALTLTKPALQYDQNVGIDPETGMPLAPISHMIFFKNPAERAKQFAADASKAVAPATSDVSGTVEDSAASLNPAPTPSLPKFAQPKLSELMTDEQGLPRPLNSGETKLGKLLHFITAVSRGAAAGSGQQSFGAGYQAAAEQPYRDLAMRQQAEQGGLQTEILRNQVAQLPWARAAQLLGLQKQRADIERQQAEAAAIPVETLLKKTQAEAANFKDDPNLGLIDIRTGKPVVDSTVAISDPTQAIVLGKQVGDRVPLKLLNTASEIANRGLEVVTAGGQVQLVDKKAGGKVIKSFGKATPLMVSQIKDSGTDTDIEAAAQALVDPKNLTTLRQISSYRGDQRLKIFNRARQIDPNFDAGMVEQRAKFLGQYEDPKGRAAINRQSINNIIQHAGDLSGLNQQYRRTNVRIVNTAINKIANEFGNDLYTQYSTVNGVLKDELALYFAGGYAPNDDQKKMWDKIQADEATPAQTESFAKEVIRLGLRRATTFNSQFRKNMGYDDPNMIIPEAKDAATTLGLGSEISKFGSGGQYRGPSSQNTPSTEYPPGVVKF